MKTIDFQRWALGRWVVSRHPAVRSGPRRSEGRAHAWVPPRAWPGPLCPEPRTLRTGRALGGRTWRREGRGGPGGAQRRSGTCRPPGTWALPAPAAYRPLFRARPCLKGRRAYAPGGGLEAVGPGCKEDKTGNVVDGGSLSCCSWSLVGGGPRGAQPLPSS